MTDEKQSPHKTAVTVHLCDLTLYFPHSLHQRLQLILVPSLPTSGLTLRYDAQILTSPDQPSTRARVGKILGPTYASSSSSKLSYPGISFDLSNISGGREDLVHAITVTPRSEQPASLGPVSSVVIHVRSPAA